MEVEKPSKKTSKDVFLDCVAECELLLAFTFFAIAGNMGRNGLIELTSFESYGSIWPNFTGCVVIAFSSSILNSVLFPLVTTGFCGAMTTFSELITDVFLQSTTPKPNWPNHGYGVPMFMARLLIELNCSFAGYLVGIHLGKLYEYLQFGKLSVKNEVLVRRLLEFLGLAAWVVCLVTSITTKSEKRWWALSGVFSPFGVWLRYYLAKLNKPNRWFKWGTFAANIFGTLLACVFQTCILLPTTSSLQRQILTALQKGLVGCLTTISTFVKEMNTMRTGKAYIYGIITLFCAYSLAFIIIGSYKWTR